jgi:recombination protein RecT
MPKEKELVKHERKIGFIEKFQSQPDIKAALISYLGDENKLIKFVSSMRMCFAMNPKLKNCTPDSLRNVFLNCAEWGLYPSHVTGECYVIPYKDEATFQLGYQGMITLAYRAGVKHIDAQVVYENDVFEYEYGLNQSLKHVPDKFSADRGKSIGAYAVATLDSGIQKFEIMSEADIFKHRAKSQSWRSSQKYSPWNPENDPQLIMWRKTCLKQLFKMLPKTPVMQQAIAADIQGDIINMKSESDVMTQDEIKEFYEGLLKQYDTDDIGEAIFKVRENDTLDDLTRDEAKNIEQHLAIYTPTKAEEASVGNDGQGELL